DSVIRRQAAQWGKSAWQRLAILDSIAVLSLSDYAGSASAALISADHDPLVELYAARALLVLGYSPEDQADVMLRISRGKYSRAIIKYAENAVVRTVDEVGATMSEGDERVEAWKILATAISE